uniref:Uncharacterized protein n=3 Tax=Candidatus Bipolaricaulota TaxID=67810 RepID=H5S8Y2_9BACT|nr:hypothetical protein HGMM_F01H03C20 [uncultured Acetothermia bacterium]
MRYLWIFGMLVLGTEALAQERAPSLGIAMSWMELKNFQPALPTFEISQKVLIFSVRGETQIELGVALRLAAGWGFAFEGTSLGIAHYETALALNFPFGRASASVELGTGIMHFTQHSEEAWRLTGWVGAGGRFALFPKISFFFDVAPLVLLDFSQHDLPWVWSYRGGALWRF